MKILPYTFYDRNDVNAIARELIGKILVTNFEGVRTSGRIVETEAYAGIIDRASHAYGGRRTKRTEIMFGEAGKTYVYLCYGIHHLFNVVSNKVDIPHATLIRALEPIDGIEYMLARTGKPRLDFTITRGPGNLSKAMGIRSFHTGISLLGEDIFIADDGQRAAEDQILSSPRIGVDYAGEDALLPYRYFLKNNVYVSGKKPVNPPTAG